jgi:hypothetical protein
MVLFQAELVFEGVDDRLDPLAHPAQRAEPARLILAIRTNEAGAQCIEVALEGPTGKPLIGQDDRARRQGMLAGSVIHQHLGDRTLTKLRGGQAPGDRHAVRGREQVQLEPPVPAAVAAVIAVAGMAPQRRALTVSRDWPQGSGVASSSRNPSHQDGAAIARWRMARLRWWAAWRRRLL